MWIPWDGEVGEVSRIDRREGGDITIFWFDLTSGLIVRPLLRYLPRACPLAACGPSMACSLWRNSPYLLPEEDRSLTEEGPEEIA